MIDFKTYVKRMSKHQICKETGVQDFFDDAAADKTFPNVKTWRQLEAYLMIHRACEGAMSAATKAFDSWKALSRE